VLAAVLIVAAGTYLMRLLPLCLSLYRRAPRAAPGGTLSLAGPALLASFLVVSLVPAQQQLAVSELMRRLLSLLVVLIVQKKWSNIGAAVLAGMLAYALQLAAA